MKENLVSIIMPAYNCEKFIMESVNSVLKQTYKNWELLITDDKSTDDTCKLLDDIAKTDKRIKVFHLKENSGAAVARNNSLSMADGEFIAFLDSDDRWKSDKLTKQIKFMKENNCAFCFSSYEFIRKPNSGKTRIVKVPKSISYDESLRNTIIGCLTVVINKKIVGDFRMPLVRAGQDHLTWWAILKKGYKAYGINESLAEYREVEGSISNSRIKAIKRHWLLYRKYEKLSLFKSSYCFIGYAYNAIIKHYFS